MAVKTEATIGNPTVICVYFVVLNYKQSMRLQVISHKHVISNCPGMVRVFVPNDASDQIITFIYVMLFML